MKRYQSVLSFFLAAIAIFLVSCGGPTTVAKAPTYTTAQLEQIQHYLDDVNELRDRMLEIPPLVQKGDWTTVGTFIHGPLGELRVRMSRLARSLDPRVQPAALQAAKDVFGHLNAIDEATQVGDVRKALFNYNQALADFESFFKLLPTSGAA